MSLSHTSTLKATTVSSSTMPLKVGIVGLGKIGMLRSRYIQAHSELQLVAVCDRDSRKTEAIPDCLFYGDFQDLVESDLDVVFVCTYNDIAPEIVIQALNQGKHVFCEKPPGRCVKDVERIIAAEKANSELKLKFGFNHRYHHSVIEAKKMVDRGQLGKILWLRGVYGKCGGIEFEHSWRNQSEISGGGILLDQGIHMLDLLRYFVGDFTEVQSAVTTSYWNIPVEDNAFAILRNEKNQIAMLHSSATQWKHRFSLEICLEDGYINLNGILSSTRSYGDESLTFAKKQFENETFALGKPKEETIFFDRDDSWQFEIQEFVEAIKTQKPITSGNSQDALKVMQLIEQIYRQGRR